MCLSAALAQLCGGHSRADHKKKRMKVEQIASPTANNNNNNKVTANANTNTATGSSTIGFFAFLWKARRKDKDLPPPNQDEHKLYLEENVLERKVPDADLRQLIDLPIGLDYNEWLASHTLAFFEHINLIYGTISEFCTMSGCPDMVGPCQRQYQWYDEKGKKCKVAAPQYIDYVMTFTQKTINDECIFPSKYGNEFPTSFESIVKKIHRLLFHVVAHLYCAHFKEIWMLALHSHLNCLFAHMVLFNERFKLIEDKETEILNDLVVALKLHPDHLLTATDDADDCERPRDVVAAAASATYEDDDDSGCLTTIPAEKLRFLSELERVQFGGANLGGRLDVHQPHLIQIIPSQTPDLVLSSGDTKLQQ